MTEENTGEMESDAGAQGSAGEQPQENHWENARKTMAEQKQKLDLMEQEQQRLKSESQLWQQQAMLYQANMNKQEPHTSPWESIKDEDIVTGAEFKKAITSWTSSAEKKLEETTSQLKTMAYKKERDDWDQCVSLALEEAQRDPALLQALASSSDPHLMAYRVGRSSERYKPKERVQESSEAKAILSNAQVPSSINSATTGHAPLSKAERYLSMSDAEFEAHIASVKRRSP